MDLATKYLIGIGALILAWEVFALLTKHKTFSEKIWQWVRLHPVKVSASIGFIMGATFGHWLL